MKLKLQYIILLLLVTMVLLKFRESFAATSPGTLLQLTAYGAQDIYLTGGDRRPAMPFEPHYNIQKY